MNKILYTTDFSDASKSAFEHTKDIARHFGADIYLLHVFEPLELDAKTPGDQREDILQERRAGSLVMMREFAGMAGSDNDHYRYIAVPGKAVEEIIAVAEREFTDLIIMGTHGAGSIKEYMMGSNTAAVIADAPCNVMAIPEDSRYRGIYRVVLAVDYNYYNTGNLKRLNHFLAGFGAEVVVVHVLKKGEESLPDKGQQEKVINELYDPGRVTYQLLHGEDVYETIKDFAEDYNADLICMKYRKHTAWDNVFHKSLTKKMAYQTKIPLLAFQ